MIGSSPCLFHMEEELEAGACFVSSWCHGAMEKEEG